MISFRFHVVSIAAVFLAIAIGVVIGTTLVERTLLDTLRNRIETVSNNLDERKAENDELERQLEESQAAITSSLEFAVTDRLVDVPVLVLAARGVDDDAVAQTVTLARQAGGVVPGVVWIEPKWSLEADGDLEALAALVGAPASAPSEAVVREVWDAVALELELDEAPEEALPEETGDPTTTTTEGDDSTTTTTEGDEPTTAVLDALIEGGFLAVDALGDERATLTDLAGRGARVLLVTGTEADADAASMVPVSLDAALATDLDVVVADVFVAVPEGPSRGEAITDTIDEDVRDTIGLVDDADLPQGHLAAVLALDAIGNDVAGHWGYGSDADDVLPPWSPL